MKIYCEENYDAMSRRAAEIMAEQIKNKPDSVLGLATGSTPVGMYKNLYNADFSRVVTVNLDEYVGLDAMHDQSYRYFMNENLFKHTNINLNSTNVPDGMAQDAEAECARYDKLIESLGGIDMQLLGLGQNGHIGFNEPDDVFLPNTHVVELTESTINANARFFESRDDVPRRAITMGVGAIMRAKCVLMVASGENKAQAVKSAFSGPVTPRVPASILQLHPNVILVGDKAALKGLMEAGVTLCS